MSSTKGGNKLPVDDILEDLASGLKHTPNAVVTAAPGAGKTTRVAPALLRLGVVPAGQSIVLLQPRRVAARASAARIAAEQGWRLGEEVGYQIRFENRTSARTQIRVSTEGILTRQIQSDPFLEGVGCVILDEFHERSIHSDVALALLREIQQEVRPDLRIVVMSATLEVEPVRAFLGECLSFDSAGRTFPVEVKYLPRPDSRPVWDKAAAATREAVAADRSGHVLVFLPGMGEIRRTLDLLEGLPAKVHVLHSAVSAEEQDAALAPSSTQKVILATNIAETSLTIDGVTTVVDSGLARVALQDAALGVDRLELRRISQASATQRTGRAGRTAPGRCQRLWTLEEQSGLPPQDVAEIHRIDLAPTLLSFRAFGSTSPTWFEAPDAQRLARAEDLLEMLGCVDANGQLTPLGKRLARLPVHPRLGALLLAGARYGYGREAAGLAALLSEEVRVESSRTHAALHSESDALLLLDALERGGLGEQRYPVNRLREQLARLVDREERRERGLDRETALRLALLHAYPDRVTIRREQDASRGAMVGNRGVVLEPSSSVRSAPLFLSLNPRDDPRDRVSESRVSLASAIEAEWLRRVHPHLLHTVEKAQYDAEKDKVLGLRVVEFAGLTIEQRITGKAMAEAAGRALVEHVNQRPGGVAAYLLSQESLTDWLSRVLMVQHYVPEAELQRLDKDHLEAAFTHACEGLTSLSQLQAARVLSALSHGWSYQQKAAVDEHAPGGIAVPSGRRHAVQYPAVEVAADGSLALPPGPPAPVVAARIQEMFGLADTPRICKGRLPVVLHLLAPNYRPMQVTVDLRSFWNGTYAEVRKELRGRYPKHPWPEDPWNAPAVSIGRRRV